MTVDLLAPARPLSALLVADAALCGALGLAGLLAPAAVADLLGPDVPTAVVRWLGLALLAYAADLALLSRSRWARTTALVAAVGNLAWEVATVVLVVLGAFSVSGAVCALVVAALVGGLGLVQLRALRG